MTVLEGARVVRHVMCSAHAVATAHVLPSSARVDMPAPFLSVCFWYFWYITAAYTSESYVTPQGNTAVLGILGCTQP